MRPGLTLGEARDRRATEPHAHGPSIRENPLSQIRREEPGGAHGPLAWSYCVLIPGSVVLLAGGLAERHKRDTDIEPVVQFSQTLVAQ